MNEIALAALVAALTTMAVNLVFAIISRRQALSDFDRALPLSPCNCRRCQLQDSIDNLVTTLIYDIPETAPCDTVKGIIAQIHELNRRCLELTCDRWKGSDEEAKH